MKHRSLLSFLSIVPLLLTADAGGSFGGSAYPTDTSGTIPSEPENAGPSAAPDVNKSGDQLNDPGTEPTPVDPQSRQPGENVSTAVKGPGPNSETDPKGNFAGEPGTDIQKRDPIAPTETRNAAVASSTGAKAETHVSRADEKALSELTQGTSGASNVEHFDVRSVPPANVDQDAKKSYDKAVEDSRANRESLEPVSSSPQRSEDDQLLFNEGAAANERGEDLKDDAPQAFKDGYNSVKRA